MMVEHKSDTKRQDDGGIEGILHKKIRKLKPLQGVMFISSCLLYIMFFGK